MMAPPVREVCWEKLQKIGLISLLTINLSKEALRSEYIEIVWRKSNMAKNIRLTPALLRKLVLQEKKKDSRGPRKR